MIYAQLPPEHGQDPPARRPPSPWLVGLATVSALAVLAVAALAVLAVITLR